MWKLEVKLNPTKSTEKNLQIFHYDGSESLYLKHGNVEIQVKMTTVVAMWDHRNKAGVSTILERWFYSNIQNYFSLFLNWFLNYF